MKRLAAILIIISICSLAGKSQERIFYTARSQSDHFTIFSVKPDGSGKKQLFDDEWYRTGVNVTPDGELYYLKKEVDFPQTIPYVSGKIYLCKSDISGNNETNLYSFASGYDYDLRGYIDLRPDKKEILYTTYASIGNRDGDVYKLDLNTFISTNLTNDLDYLPHMARYVPGADKIVYVKLGTVWYAYPWIIFFINPDGSGKIQITPDGNASFIFPSFSHDGKKMLYCSYTGLGSPLSLHIADPDGSNSIQITPTGGQGLNISNPMFSPDDSKIAFYANGKILIIKPDGTVLNEFDSEEIGDQANLVWATVNERNICSVTSQDIAICQGESFMGHNVTGIFSDTLVSSLGCDSVVHTNLKVNPKPVLKISSSAEPVCKGTSAILTVTGSSSYEWSGGLGNNDQITVTPALNTTYTVTGTTDGCSDKVSFTVNVLSKPDAGFTWSPEIISVNNPVVTFTDQSQGQGPMDLHWQVGKEFVTAEKEFQYTFSDSGSYKITLMVSDKNGCRDTIEKTLEVMPPAYIFIPNAFSPNDDGFNDYFGPETRGIITLRMDIFDREGRLINRIDSVNGKWNGDMPSGSGAPQGIYFYSMKATGVDMHDYQSQGSVTLYRETSNQAGAFLFPNPSSSKALLKFSSSFEGEKRVSVFNSAGNIVKSFTTREEETEIEMPPGSSGFYLIRIRQNGENIILKMIRY